MPFRDLKNDPVRLAKEVLAEVPRQLVGFYQKYGIQPNAKKMQDKADIVVKGKMKNALQKQMKVSDDFFVGKKNEMANILVNQGYNSDAVYNFINTYGMPDFNPDWIANMSEGPQAMNGLK